MYRSVIKLIRPIVMTDKDMEINWNSTIRIPMDRGVIGLIGPTGVLGGLGCPELL